MADDGAGPDHTGHKPLHPFFAPNRVAAPMTKSLEPNTATTTDTSLESVNSGNTGKSAEAPDTAKPRGKRRKTVTDQDDDEEPKKTQSRKRVKPAASRGIASHFIRLKGDAESSVTGPENSIASLGSFLSASGPSSEQNNLETEGTEGGHSPSTLPQVLCPGSGGNIIKPKKELQLNLEKLEGSSASLPSIHDQLQSSEKGVNSQDSGEPSRRSTTKSVIVNIKYGIDDDARVRIGNKISDIVSPTPTSEMSPRATSKKTRSPGAAKSTTPKRPKTTHPFFLGKAKKAEALANVEEAKPKKADKSPVRARMKEFSSTPCSPKKPRAADISVPQFGVKNAGLKFPGSKLPAWPYKDMVHVRGDATVSSDTNSLAPPPPLRKSKGHAVKIAACESILGSISQQLAVPDIAEDLRNVNTDEFLPAPPELRLPTKHFESGRKLLARILPELKTLKTPQNAGKGSGSQAAKVKDAKLRPPPQLERLFGSVASGLSAFDKSECETASWTQKYAPSSTVEVLQPGREQFLLRDWLQALMVQSVDTGTADGDKLKNGSSKGKAGGTGKKKRRKKLDGFIVSSDDEDYELYALSDDDADWTASGSRGILRKTVVRSSDLSRSKDGEKIANTLVISGPTGCGKTALVYAAAKELDYEVFEINSSSRRSGKDVLEKIGDMTRNHLVQQQPSVQQTEGQPTAEDGVTKDLKPGKQSTMNTFFKLKAGAAKAKKSTEAPSDQPKSAKKEGSKSQRQSLILLEEADILYEEDKQFWATVVSLMVQSKRPFIITCNDETLLPLQILRLHGIFRLSAPPRDLAVDRLILVAANEGHALIRGAVESLYDSRHEDLRAATTDLQFWCQIGVGDRRGGFEWFYPRWPIGIDRDDDGDVVRVVSEGTYNRGMNLFGRDTIVNAKGSPISIEEELLCQSWEFWALDVGHWQDSIGLGSWAEEVSAAATPESRVTSLHAFDDLADAMSIADMGACNSFAAFKQELLDTTLPDLPSKIREDFILGSMHLDTPLVIHYDASPASIATTIKSLAKSTLRAKTSPLVSACDLCPLTESETINCIQTSFTTPIAGTDSVSRIDFAFAFDPIAVPESPSQAVSYLEPSVLDRTFKMIALDVAPYIRGIVAYDMQLQKQRLQLSSLVSEGGKAAQGSKRMRTTRAALSALEGGSRSTIRSEKWFKAETNPFLIMKTGGKGWANLWPEAAEASSRPASPPSGPSPASSSASSQSPPKETAKKPARRGRPRKKVIRDESADELGDAATTP